MSEAFPLPAGDRLPVLTGTLTGADGAAADLTGAAVELRVWDWRLGAAVLTAAAENLDAGTPTRGQVRYQWTGSEGLAVGWYRYRWRATFAGGKAESFPNDGYGVLVVPGG